MDDKVLEMMRRWNATEESLALAEQLRKQQQGNPDDFEVWEDNWAHWCFFLRISSQWLYAGFEGARGCLNLAGVEVVARAAGVRGKAWAEQLAALLVIEREVLEVDARRREQRTG
ncbi:DUF1799 domain-containing protein [Hydrogenophaga sp.]|uniref:DUF1799 domain-containing protein n=1 Tax=Hydrogenophaga sp. TaxID=1904254 RepID=UPI003D0C3BB0